MKSSSRLLFRLRPCIRPSNFTPIKPALSTPFLHPVQAQSFPPRRPFTSQPATFKGLQPDTHDPKPPATERHSPHVTEPAALSATEYNEIADQYIDSLVLALEEMAEDAKKGVEVEYSAGVLTLNHPSGTYIINKQPPNKQIWLSSPVSGPKRYDWVLSGDGQHQKEGTETQDHDHHTGGKWMYLRDGSTLSELLEKEVGVDIGGEGDATAGREGPAGGGATYSGSE